MRIKIFVLLISVSFSGVVVADRPLEKVEILQIFEILTKQPKKTWISSGTITARHQEQKKTKITDAQEISYRINNEVQAYLENPNKLELTKELQQMKLEAIPFNVRYKLSNEYSMSSSVIVRFDGSRFYWEIQVDSRTDSLQPPVELAGNFLTEEFDLNWNQKRVFAWDGEKYTTYFRPGNHAIIRGAPSGVNGPLTAGIIPWGYGRYSYENLSNAQYSASEVQSNGRIEIHLTVIDGDKHDTFILDPEKNYTVSLYSTTVENTYMTVRNYSDYKMLGDNWYPRDITIEQYDTTMNPPILKAIDIWNFISIDIGTPEPGSFGVEYQFDALIEDYRFGTKPLQFRYLPPQEPSARDIDIDEILQKRLEMAFSTELQNQNCATVSLKYVCGKLGISPSWEDLGKLVHGPAKGTTMFEMQQFVERLGFNSIAAKTDLETLKTLGDCQVILYLPMDNHYLVLGNIDDKYVRLIDLDDNRFYYRNRTDYFSTIWDGTALVIANGPIAMKGYFARIDNARLRELIGAAECQSCTDLIQAGGDSPCPDPGPFGTCGGDNTIYYDRYGCEASTSGSCSEGGLVGSVSEPCIVDPDDYTGKTCIGYGSWTSSSISACR